MIKRQEVYIHVPCVYLLYVQHTHVYITDARSHMHLVFFLISFCIRAVFLCAFISAFFVYFEGPLLLEMQFCATFSPWTMKTASQNYSPLKVEHTPLKVEHTMKTASENYSPLKVEHINCCNKLNCKSVCKYINKTIRELSAHRASDQFGCGSKFAYCKCLHTGRCFRTNYEWKN